MTVATITSPTFCRVPAGDETTGQGAVDLAAAYGVPLDEWHAHIVRGILREDTGAWAASRAGRQNGKGQVILAMEL